MPIPPYPSEEPLTAKDWIKYIFLGTIIFIVLILAAIGAGFLLGNYSADRIIPEHVSEDCYQQCKKYRETHNAGRDYYSLCFEDCIWRIMCAARR